MAIIEATVEAETKSEPVIVGMDKNFISSELSFYAFADHEGLTNTGGRIFGERSLMGILASWFGGAWEKFSHDRLRSAQAIRPVVIAAFRRRATCRLSTWSETVER